jgi:SAM-dependent methyltransferase
MVRIFKWMVRENRPEILDDTGVPEELIQKAYQDIARIHHWLGDTKVIVRSIREHPLPVGRILDVGCATGIVLEEVGRRLGVDVIGADINPHPSIAASVPIVRANALFDPLPCADVAFSMHVGHHLSASDLVKLIRNVGRSCRRFILLDSVRHPWPLALFRRFVAPFICPIDAEDGQRSIRRSYTPSELETITASALIGTAGRFRLSVAPFYIRQVVDISYEDAFDATSARIGGHLRENPLRTHCPLSPL